MLTASKPLLSSPLFLYKISFATLPRHSFIRLLKSYRVNKLLFAMFYNTAKNNLFLRYQV